MYQLTQLQANTCLLSSEEVIWRHTGVVLVGSMAVVGQPRACISGLTAPPPYPPPFRPL